MKTLYEIVDDVRNGERPDYEDLRYAICAMDALITFDRGAFMHLAEAEGKCKEPFLTTSAKWQWEECFNRHKRAFNTPPKEYVGWNNDPENPDFRKRRSLAKKIANKITKSVELENKHENS